MPSRATRPRSGKLPLPGSSAQRDDVAVASPRPPRPKRPIIGGDSRGLCSVLKPRRQTRVLVWLQEGLPDAAGEAGLRYVSDEAPGISRRRKGRGLSYRLPQGGPIRDSATLARIRSLAIPPAWTQVWICPDPEGHIQATGRDQKARKQYRY